MPTSRQQQIEQNVRRLKEIATELEAIAEIQSQSTDAIEQRDCLIQLSTLGGEQRALENANTALQKELEQAAKEKVEADKRIWLEQERPLAEKERDTACAKVMARIRSVKKAYDALVQTEQRWRDQWNERGRPQYLNQDRPFVTSARRDIYSFLGMDKRPRASQTSNQKEIAEILGPTAQVRLIVGAEKRRAARRQAKEDKSARKIADEKRAARKKELAGVEKLQAEASPSQGEQVEGNGSAGKTADGADE